MPAGYAQSSGEPAQKAEQAQKVKQLNEAGLEAFAEGEYESAAVLFGRAYKLDARPELLKNRAVALYRAGDYEQATRAAERFIETQAASEEAEQVEMLLLAARVALAERALEAADYGRLEAYLSQIEPADAPDELSERVAYLRAAGQIHEQMKRSAVLSTRASAQNHLRRLDGASPTHAAGRPVDAALADDESAFGPSTGVWLVGAGSALIASAAVYHVLMSAAVEPEFHAAARAGDRRRYHEFDAQLRTANWLVPTLYGLGAASAAGGLWLIVDVSETQPPGGGPAHITEAASWGLRLGGKF